MKKTFKILAITIIIAILMPFTMVNATTSRTEKIVESLKESAKSYDGIVNFENGTIEIEWNVPNLTFRTIEFTYTDNVIEYNSGEITSYEQAEDVISHSLYAMYLIESALRVNGYSDEEIQSFWSFSEPSYDINGIELKHTGEPQKFTSEDGTSTTTVAPTLIKIDVTKANPNTSSDEPVTPKSTTIEDIIADLQVDSEFRSTLDDEGKVMVENEISNDDKKITIDNTSYMYQYYNVIFDCEDDVLTYEDGELEDYYDVERASSHHMYANYILMIALKMNGYTNEEIQEFMSSEDNEFDYELNGIEIKKIGEEKTFKSADGSSTVTTTPLSFKIDLEKANINKKDEIDKKTEYKILEGAEQTYKIGEDTNLTFRFDIDYDTFKTYGEIWIDEMRIEEDKYTSKSGSTIITLNDEYTKTLSEGKHHLEIPLAQGRLGIAKTDFYIKNAVENKTADIKEVTQTVEKEQKAEQTVTGNPKTGDSISIYLVMAVATVILITVITVVIKRRK